MLDFLFYITFVSWDIFIKYVFCFICFVIYIYICLFQSCTPKIIQKLLALPIYTPILLLRWNLPWCAALLLIPLCLVAKEGHDNYGKICVFEWIIVKWWINKFTPCDDWFSGNDTPESLNLQDSTASDGERKGTVCFPRQTAKTASNL